LTHRINSAGENPVACFLQLQMRAAPSIAVYVFLWPDADSVQGILFSHPSSGAYLQNLTSNQSAYVQRVKAVLQATVLFEL
jgi:hypothetical protein